MFEVSEVVAVRTPKVPLAPTNTEAKKLVVVALVVVELTTFKRAIDDEALMMMPTVEVGVMAVVPENCQFDPPLPEPVAVRSTQVAPTSS